MCMTTNQPRIGATGIGVSDLRRSADFYMNVFGMKEIMKFHLDTMDEIVLGLERGPALVLMCHTDGVERDFARTGGKVVFYVSDPVATAEKASELGAKIERTPAPVPELGDAVVGFITDLDGHLVELLQD